jgi:hypothetical protein
MEGACRNLNLEKEKINDFESVDSCTNTESKIFL